MLKTMVRWAIYFAAALAIGPLAGAIMAWLRAPDGGNAATPLVSTQPLLGLGAGALVIVIGLAAGFIAVRHMGAKPGMIAAGLVLAWAAWRTGTVDELIRQNDSGRVLWLLALEGLIFGAAVVVIPLLLMTVERLEREDGEAHEAAGVGWRRGLAPIPAGLAAGGVVAWAIAQTPLKGQAVAAAALGGVFAAAAGRLVDVRASLPTLAIPIAILAVLGPLSGIVMGASQDLLVAGRNGTLFPLANILPLDWIAGGLLGIPWGVAWAGSLIEKREAKS